jgi:hypothetical protein
MIEPTKPATPTPAPSTGPAKPSAPEPQKRDDEKRIERFPER